ncbi:MAG: type II toxin-antitoxin system HipA family toxin [Deferrisomatales bacterium]
MGERKLVVFVYLPGETTAVPAGIFTHNDDPIVGSFAYGRRYLERENALAVDPVALPLGPAPRDVTTNGGLYGSFRDAAPDHWGRLVVAAEARVPPEALSEIDYLVAANATRAGNLDFRASPNAPEPALDPPHFAQLPLVTEAAERVEQGEAVEDHLLRLLRQGSSLGGARPKCTVQWNGALWLAKFPARGDTWNVPRVEYATMALAGRCGIRVPETRLERAGDKDVYLVRRFDREHAGTGWLRRGFFSSLSLMQWDEGDRHLWSYGSIADTMRRYVSATDIRELFRRMVFHIAVRNTDDHPRNHGFLVEGQRISLSPAYDVVPEVVRTGVGRGFRLAMSVGEQGREATVENALSHAARFGLGKDEAAEVVREVTGTARQWEKLFRESGVSERDLGVLAGSFVS